MVHRSILAGFPGSGWARSGQKVKMLNRTRARSQAAQHC